MNKVQNSLEASDAEPASPYSASPGPVPGQVSSQAAMTDAAAWGRTDLDDGAGPDGHTLLNRPPAPTYRRSLFRR